MNAELAITRGVERIDNELRERLEFSLSVSDEIAFATALTKVARMAFLEGLRRAQEAQEVAAALDRGDTTVSGVSPDRDIWQEIYGKSG